MDLHEQENFKNWVRYAKPGERFVYATDKAWLRLRWTLSFPGVIRDAHETGQIVLVQKRVPGTTRFDYIAEKVSPKTIIFLDGISKSISHKRPVG